MNALFRLITQTGRALFAILALIIGLAFLGMAWHSWANSETATATMAGFGGLLLIIGAFKLRPRRLADRPTRKQLAFAARLGIDPKGMDKWALSEAIDEALDDREVERKTRA